MSQQKPRKDKNTNYNKVIMMTGAAFEMAALIILCVFLGKFLDDRLNMEKPIFTAMLSIFGVMGSILNLIRKVKKNS